MYEMILDYISSYSHSEEFLSLCVLVIITSFFGYVTETVWVALRHGFIDNRGMHLPFLLGYGMATFTIYVIFGSVMNPKLYFISDLPVDPKLIYLAEIFVFVTVCESALGNIVEKTCGIQWWNYNSIPLHLGQYTSIPTSIGFTFGIHTIINSIFLPVQRALLSEGIIAKAPQIILLTVLLIIDCIYALLYMHKHGETYVFFHKELDHSIQDLHLPI